MYCADVPGGRAILQAVGKRVDIALEDEWGTRKPRTQIVAIGAPGSLHAGALRDRFDPCVTAPTGG